MVTRKPATYPDAPASVGNLFGRLLVDPAVAVTAGKVYVAWQLSPPASARARSAFARINPVSGRVRAVRRLKGAFDQATLADGALWVVTSSARETLLKLDPKTLRLAGRWPLGGPSIQPWGEGVLVVAGHGLWVAAGNRLVHLSLPAARLLGSIALPSAQGSDLSTNPPGTALLVGEADNGGRGAVERRDPATGALLASHRVGFGVTAPFVAGPLDGAVWISEPTGMMGFVRRLNATTLAAEGTCREGASTTSCVEGDNAVFGRLADHLLWVTQPAGGKMRNYCADPADGQRLAPIGQPQGARDQVLGVGPHQIFYAELGRRGSEFLRREPIPPACHLH